MSEKDNSVQHINEGEEKLFRFCLIFKYFVFASGRMRMSEKSKMKKENFFGAFNFFLPRCHLNEIKRREKKNILDDIFVLVLGL